MDVFLTLDSDVCGRGERARVRRVHRHEPELREGVVRRLLRRRTPGDPRVLCSSTVYTDSVCFQYAGASSVEVTGGPDLLKHIKPGRCVSNAASRTSTLTLIPSNTRLPPNH